MTFDDVRVIHGDTASLPYQGQRSDPQKHTDEALARAAEAQDNALEDATAALRWLDAIGADIPNRLRGLPTLLAQFGVFIDDERRRRG